MTKIVYILILVLLFSCSEKGEKTETNITGKWELEIKPNVESNNSVIHNNEATTDSLRSPFHMAYYSDISMREFGLLVLNDSIRPMDNDMTFKLMDSITSSSKDSRDFYYPIFQHIADISDSALSEVIGGYAMEYASKYPNEFYNRYSCDDSLKLNCEQLIVIAKFIQYEIGMQENIEETWKALLDKMDTEKHRYPEDHLSIIFVDNVTNGLKNYIE